MQTETNFFLKLYQDENILNLICRSLSYKDIASLSMVDKVLNEKCSGIIKDRIGEPLELISPERVQYLKDTLVSTHNDVERNREIGRKFIEDQQREHAKASSCYQKLIQLVKKIVSYVRSCFGWEENESESTLSELAQIEKETERSVHRQLKGKKRIGNSVYDRTDPDAVYKYYVKCARNLPRLPKSFTEEEALSIDSIFLCHYDIRYFPSNLGQLKQITMIHLIDTKITRLPDSIGELIYLKYLTIENSPIRSIPESLGNCKNLKWLSLQKLKLETRQLPDSLGHLTKLYWMTLVDLGLETIPDFIDRIDCGTCFFDLRNNQIAKISDERARYLVMRYSHLFINLEDNPITATDVPASIRTSAHVDLRTN